MQSRRIAPSSVIDIKRIAVTTACATALVAVNQPSFAQDKATIEKAS